MKNILLAITTLTSVLLSILLFVMYVERDLSRSRMNAAINALDTGRIAMGDAFRGKLSSGFYIVTSEDEHNIFCLQFSTYYEKSLIIMSHNDSMYAACLVDVDLKKMRWYFRDDVLLMRHFQAAKNGSANEVLFY